MDKSSDHVDGGEIPLRTTKFFAALLGLLVAAVSLATPAQASGFHQEYRDTCLGLQTRYVYDGQGSDSDVTAWRTVDTDTRYRCYDKHPGETSSSHTEFRKRRGVLQVRVVTVFREVVADPAGSGQWMVVPDRDTTRWTRFKR